MILTGAFRLLSYVVCRNFVPVEYPHGCQWSPHKCVWSHGLAAVSFLLAFSVPIQYDSVPESVQIKKRGRCPAK